MTTFTLENETLCLEFDRDTGALVGLTAVETGWRILDRPDLGLSFRLLVPQRRAEGGWFSDANSVPAGTRNNPVYGEKQRLTSL